MNRPQISQIDADCRKTSVEVWQGNSPIVLAFPHPGLEVPPTIWERLNENGRLLADTDWHLPRLYEGLLPDATTVQATFHRYVIDANRDPAGTSLYPGQNTTSLIPMTDFDGEPIWRTGLEPTASDLADRLAAFHVPYHSALAAEIERVKTLHGKVLLYDCHSIRSHIPFLFSGKLPDFNIGTNDGRTCAPAFQSAAIEIIGAAPGFTSVLNGRFKGGWTTRHYGQPEQEMHAVQMELAQSTYLTTEAPPFAYDPVKADKLRVHLKALLEKMQTIAFGLL